MINRNKVFVLFSLSFFILIFILENINGRFWLNDFKVYYFAAESLLEGKPVYGTVFGLDTGYYKYSPFVLLVFAPFCLFSFYTAAVIQFVLIAVSAITAFLVIQSILSEYLFDSAAEKKNALLFSATLCIIGQLFRELHMGNVNMLIVLLLSSGLLFSLKNRFVIAGVCIGIAIMIKPYFLLLMLPLLLHKKIKTMISVVCTMIVAVIVPLLLLGFSKGMRLHQNWVASMIHHNAYITSNQNIQSMINYYISSSIPNAVQYYIILAMLAAYVCFFLYNRKLAKKSLMEDRIMNASFITGYFVLFAIIPNLLLTDTEHFIFSLPLIIFLLNYLSVKKDYVAICAFIVVILFYSGGSPDIVGSAMYNKLDRMGGIGISNLLLIGACIYVIIKYKGQLNTENLATVRSN